MKLRQLLAVLIVISMVLVPAFPPSAHAASSSYTEKLTTYVAGTDAAWFLTLGNINASNPTLASVEAIPGVTWYNVTALDTSSWVSDFQVFGPQGYNVLPVPFIPLHGAFLTVGAVTYSDAGAAASKFGSYLLTSFQSYSNSTGVYTFFAPFSFKSIAPSTLLSFIPSNMSGFVQPVVVSAFLGLQSPIVVLEGQRGLSGFSHSLVLGSITSSGLDSSSRPSILKYFGSTPAFIQAANASSSSTIVFHFLDGVVVSSDSAKVTSNSGAFTGTYSLQLKPGEKVYGLNATVVEQPVELLATRVIDVGVLQTGSNMSVTVSLTNLSNSTALTGITLSDNWWKGSGLFKLVSGSPNVTATTVAAGQTSTPTYVLQYTGSTVGSFQIPATPVSYSYLVRGTFLQGKTSLNPMTISLGVDEPVVYAYLAPSGSLGKPVGSPQSLKVFVKNVGTRTASSVDVAGQQLGGLAPGASSSATLSATAPGLQTVNVTRGYQVSYVTPEGTSGTVSTNVLPVIFSHSGMKLAFGTLNVNSSVLPISGGGSSLNLTLDFANLGSAAATSFDARSPLPSGLACGKTGGTNLTCAGGALSLHFSGVLSHGQEHAWMVFNVTQERNFVFSPFTSTVLTSGYNLTGYSNAQPAPTGVLLSKQLNPSPLFVGMGSTVSVIASNAGPYPIYNASIATVADSFDQATSNSHTTGFRSNITAGSDFNFTYGVKTVSSANRAFAAAITALFYYGGTRFVVTQQGPRVSVYNLPSVTVSSVPSNPIEGRQFELVVTITNPASVNVTGVQFLLPVPSGIGLSKPSNAALSSGGIAVSPGQLAGGATYVATVNASASSGQAIPFSGAKLTFSYSGTTLSGKVPSGGIAIGEDVLTRYELPMGLVVLALLATAFYVRRLAGASALSSQK